MILNNLLAEENIIWETLLWYGRYSRAGGRASDNGGVRVEAGLGGRTGVADQGLQQGRHRQGHPHFRLHVRIGPGGGLSAAGVNIASAGTDADARHRLPDPHLARLRRHRGQRLPQSLLRQRHQVFLRDGQKLPDEVEERIEELLERPLETVGTRRLGKAERIVDAAGRYIEFCKSTVPAWTSLAGLKIVVDCAHGATYHIAPSVFKARWARP
jgi:hypothetical protein